MKPNGSPNLGQITAPSVKNLSSSGFCRSSGPQSGNKRKSEKIDKYFDIVRDLTKLRVTVIPIVVGA